jgi:Na+/H+ antiporter NhaC
MKTISKSFVILFFLIILIWLPFLLKFYSFSSAISITISVIITGFIGNYILKKGRKHNSQSN